MVWYGMVWYGMVWYGIKVIYENDKSQFAPHCNSMCFTETFKPQKESPSEITHTVMQAEFAQYWIYDFFDFGSDGLKTRPSDSLFLGVMDLRQGFQCHAFLCKQKQTGKIVRWATALSHIS